jgi:hypothetical protein
VILVLVLSLLELMVASQSVDMFLLMLLLLVYSVRVVVMSEWPRFKILRVSNSIYFGGVTLL